MANGVTNPDIVGQFLRGRQANQQNQLFQQQLGQQKAGQEQAQQTQQLSGQILSGQDVDANLQKLFSTNPKAAEGVLNSLGLVDQRKRDQAANFAFDLINTPAEQRAAKIQARANSLQNPSDTLQLLNMPIEQQNQALRTIQQAALSVKDRLSMKGPKSTASQGFTLSPGQIRFDAAGKEIGRGAEDKSKIVKKIEIPPVLLEGLDPAVAPKAEAAFKAAGGGKDGMVAFQKIVDSGTEQQRRLASPAILKATFPQASREEAAQLQGVMDAAKTTEAGLKEAGKVRGEQKRLKKAKTFQERAVDLLTGILESDQLGDVLGSIEGSIDFRLSDAEAELISDIEEAGNILTADNMDLMTGVLSESDIKILKNLSGGALNRKRREERFTKDVTTLRDKLSSQKVTTIDDRGASGAPKEGSTATGKNGEKAVFTNGKWEIQNAR